MHDVSRLACVRRLFARVPRIAVASRRIPRPARRVARAVVGAVDARAAVRREAPTAADDRRARAARRRRAASGALPVVAAVTAMMTAAAVVARAREERGAAERGEESKDPTALHMRVVLARGRDLGQGRPARLTFRS